MDTFPGNSSLSYPFLQMQSSIGRAETEKLYKFGRCEKPQRPGSLLLLEGLAVGTLIHGGICLVGANKDAVQRAVIFGIAVISTLLNGAFDTLVCLAAH